MGCLIPHFFDPDLTIDFRQVYVVADYLLAVACVVPFGMKQCLYRLLLPTRLYLEWRFLTQPPQLQDYLLNKW